MAEPKTYQPPFTLIHVSGTVTHFATLAELRNGARSMRIEIAAHHSHHWAPIRVDGWSYSERISIVRGRDGYPAYHWRDERWGVGVPRPTNEWIVRDVMGTIVNPFDIRDERDPRARLTRRAIIREKDRKATLRAMELGLPIPGTGHARWHRGTRLRYPSHISVDRQFAAEEADRREEDASLMPRPMNKADLPPNAWDDILRADVHHHSWKRHRRTRWR